MCKDVKSKLARSLREVHFQRNKIIFEKGEGGDCCYILCEAISLSSLVALNRRLWIENRAIQNRAAPIVRFKH